jgi:hypothetical protein
MAQPTISQVIHPWQQGKPQRFHVIGSNFDPNAAVSLQDDRADWRPATGIQVSADGNSLTFESTPQSLKRPRKAGKIKSSGALTITITNPPSTGTSAGMNSASMNVAGTYQS